MNVSPHGDEFSHEHSDIFYLTFMTMHGIDFAFS